MISEEMFRYRGRFGYVSGLSTEVFVEAIFESLFPFSFHIVGDSVRTESCKLAFRVAGNVVNNRSCFTCGMEYARNKLVGYLGTRRTMAAALYRPSVVVVV